MHKRIKVAEVELDDATGLIQKVGTVYAADHLPVGVLVRKGITDRAALNEWWTDRSIPASRSGVREALEKMEIANTKMLLTRCYGLSLSDQYWIYPKGSKLVWDSINFFENDFSDDIGDVLFGADKTADGLDFSSPDNTSDGNLKKRWKIITVSGALLRAAAIRFVSSLLMRSSLLGSWNDSAFLMCRIRSHGIKERPTVYVRILLRKIQS